MYESETLSQMFKRTKKCCAKLLRKISFTTSAPSRASIRLGGDQSARYKPQKNRPEQADATPQSSGRRSRQSQSSRSKHGTAASRSSYSEDASHDEDECQSFRISPKFFASRGASYVRVEDTNGQDDDCCSSPKTNSSQLMGSVLGKYMTKPGATSAPSVERGSSSGSPQGGGDIALADKKIYLGMNGVSGSGSDGCAAVRKPVNGSPPRRPSSGPTWRGSKNETTTSFIVAQNLIEKFDSCLNLAAQNLRNTLSPRISIYKGGAENGGFYHTIEFDILKEDASDSFSCQLDCEDYSIEEVVFEKVNYNKNKKYLRHTPSSSSMGSSNSSPKSPCPGGDGSRNDGTLMSIERMHSTFSLDDSLLIEEFPPDSLPATDRRCNSRAPGGADPNGNVDYDLEGNRRISSLPNRHFVQCDGNGNSYDSGKGVLFDDPWDMFDNKVNQARDKRLLLLRREEASTTTTRGSPKSSSTTLETWVDDEMFDNSFNEELERRYIPIDR